MTPTNASQPDTTREEDRVYDVAYLAAAAGARREDVIGQVVAAFENHAADEAVERRADERRDQAHARRRA